MLKTVHSSRKSILSVSLDIILYIVLTLAAIATIIPFIWMVSTSLKLPSEIWAFPPKWIPNPPAWQNYSAAWQRAPFLRFFLNTALMVVGVIFLQLLIFIPAAYSFARLKFRGKNVIFFIFLLTMMIPFQTRLIPTFLIVKWLTLTDNIWGVILPSVPNAFIIFLLRQFFLTIPTSLEDAARLDGCSRLAIILKIILPLSKPVIASSMLITFIWQWNSFLWPLIVLDSTEKQVVQTGLATFVTHFGTDWAQQMAASTFCGIPIIIFFIFTQRTFVRGITFTGIKG